LISYKYWNLIEFYTKKGYIEVFIKESRTIRIHF